MFLNVFDYLQPKDKENKDKFKTWPRTLLHVDRWNMMDFFHQTSPCDAKISLSNIMASQKCLAKPPRDLIRLHNLTRLHFFLISEVL